MKTLCFVCGLFGGSGTLALHCLEFGCVCDWRCVLFAIGSAILLCVTMLDAPQGSYPHMRVLAPRALCMTCGTWIPYIVYGMII
jgi:hypothetical protein